MNNLDEIQLGMTVEEVIGKLNLEKSELILIQEPPLIYRGISAILKDSTKVAISFERTSANPNDISKENGMKTVSQLKINGFAWKKKNGKSEMIGNRPKFWNE